MRYSLVFVIGANRGRYIKVGEYRIRPVGFRVDWCTVNIRLYSKSDRVSRFIARLKELCGWVFLHHTITEVGVFFPVISAILEGNIVSPKRGICDHLTYNERLLLESGWEIAIKRNTEVARVNALIGHDTL